MVTLVSGRRVPDRMLCADPKCETPISHAYTLINYGSDHPRILSFKAKESVVVYGKPSGNIMDLLDVEIRGKRGYAPKALIRETKVLKRGKEVSHLVLVEGNSEMQPVNESNVPGIHRETPKQNKATSPQKSELKAKDQASSNTIVYGEHENKDLTEPLVENVTLYNNATPDLDVSSGKVLDEPENETDHFSSATSPDPIQHTGTESQHLLYSTVPHFQRKLHAIDGSEETEDKSEEMIDESREDKEDLSYSDDIHLSGSEHIAVDAVSTDRNERIDREAALDDHHLGKQMSKEKVSGNIQDSESEPILPNEDIVRDTATVDKQEREEKVTISSEERRPDSLNDKMDEQEEGEKVMIRNEEISLDSLNDTVLEIPQHNGTNLPVNKNYSEYSSGGFEAHSDSEDDSKTGSKEQEAEMSPSDADPHDAVADTRKEVQEPHYISNHQNVLLLKETADQPPVSGHQSPEQAVDGSTLLSPTRHDMNDSEVDLQNLIELESKVTRDNSVEQPKDVEETDAVEESDVEVKFSQETVNDSVEGDKYDKVQEFASSEASVNEIKDESSSELLQDDHTLPEESKNADIKDIGRDIVQNNEDSNSYIAENISSEEEEENLPEDETAKLPSAAESYYAGFLLENPDQPSVTEASISSDSHSSYDVQPDDQTETTVSADSQDFQFQETLPIDEKSEAEDIKHGGFFTGLSGSLLSTLSSISTLGFGSSVAEEEKEAAAVVLSENLEGEDTQNKEKLASVPSPWDRDHSLQETAHHVATDPDQTGHKVDVDPPTESDLSDMSYQSSVCETGINCGGQSGLIPSEPQLQESSMSEDNVEDIHRTDGSGKLYEALSDNALYMMITAAVTGCVLAFTVMVSHFLQKPRYISLTSNIFKLEKQLLCLKTENFTLREELQKKEEELSSVQTSSFDCDKEVMLLKSELEASQAARTELEEQVTSLEKELEAATEAGLELNRMLSDFLSTQHGSETLVKSVEHLQKQLDSQQLTITEMNNNLSTKSQENENLQQELATATEKLSVQEEELQKMTDSLVKIQKEKIDLMSKMEEKIRGLQWELSQVTESTRSEISRLTTELEESRETVAMRDSELTVLQDCLRQLKAFEEGQGSEQLDALLDVGHARAELALVTMDRDSLKDRLHDEEVARKLLEDHVKVIKEEVNTLRFKFEEAEREKSEAQTRLEVLSNYFKEKETQLQRELGLQEAMYIQKEGDATSTYERIKCLQEEIENYKSQNDMLKKEIIDQERSLKGQISTLEKKAHENWVAARQAERKLEESRQEAGQLRNRLTVVEKNITNTSQNSSESGKVGDRLQAADSNGELPTSFLHMGMQEMQDPSFHQHRDRDGHPVSPPLIPGQPLPPFMGIPPPGVFMPPPPLPGAPFVPPPHFPGDRRPPPLGRMSSPPPPPHRYSPEDRSDFSPYDHSPPLSPHEYDDDDSPPRRFHHMSPPPPLAPYPPPPRQLSRWDDPHSGFRPLPPVHRESPRDSKGSALSSGHSSESLDKSSRHSGRV